MKEFVSNTSLSTDDMGFLFGFSLFETFLVNTNKQVFLLDRHVSRLFTSINHFSFDFDMSEDTFTEHVLQYIKYNNVCNKILRVTVTCGNKPKGLKPSVVFSLRDNPYNAEAFEKGCRLITAPFKKNETSPLVNHKTSNYLENLLAGKYASEKGFDDVIFLNTKGEISETSKGNIFFVSNGTIHTPDISCGLLPGIIRQWIIETSSVKRLVCSQESYSLETLLTADEVFVTNSAMGIMPVRCVGSTVIGGGKPAAATRLLAEEYLKKQ